MKGDGGIGACLFPISQSPHLPKFVLPHLPNEFFVDRKIRILVAENDSAFVRMLDDSLEESTSLYDIERVSSGEKCLQMLRKEKFDILLLDHTLSDGPGLDWLRRFNALGVGIPTIFVTAKGDPRLAMEAMKEGIFDYINRSAECAKAFPFVVHRAEEGHSLMLGQLETLVEKGLERVRLKKEVEWLRAQYRERFPSGGFIAVSRKMKEVLSLAEKLAQSSDTTVLVEGETGTGKELLAEYIHFLSSRFPFPFIPVNCGVIPKDLFESELFGYEKGAFTGAAEKGKVGQFEAAEKGTLFLDEVGELSPSAQVKILRVLEEKEYFKVGGIEKKKTGVRIIAATNKIMDSEVRKGTFRDDLYFRLNVVKLSIPPLRERREDIFALCRFFVDRFNTQFKKGFMQISRQAEEKILTYPWPGNIRELRNAVERIVLLEKGDVILGKHLSFLGEKEGSQRERGRFKPPIPPGGIILDEVEKAYITEALKMKKRNKIQAAKILGISRSALLYRMGKYGIED